MWIRLDVRTDEFLKKFEDFTRFRVAADLLLGEQRLAVDHKMEDALGAGDEREALDHVVII